MRRHVLFALFASLIGSTVLHAQNAASRKPCPQYVPTEDSQFKPGDVWMYNSRPLDPGSVVTILKVERSDKVGIVVHVRVDRVHLGNDGTEQSIQHMPFTRDALAASFLRKINSGPVPDFEAGYRNWSEHCGGVYTIQLRDAVQVAQETFQHGTTAR